MPGILERIKHPHHMRQQYGAGLMLFLIFMPIGHLRFERLLSVVGLILAVLGTYIRIWSSGYLHKNNQLTTSGPYGYVRNPIYLGNMSIGIGLMLISGRVLTGGILLILLYVFCYIPGMNTEVENLRKRFREDMDEYIASVPLIVPRFLRSSKYPAGRWALSAYARNREIYVTVGLIAGIAYLWFRRFA